jgi:hypothetical protein
MVFKAPKASDAVAARFQARDALGRRPRQKKKRIGWEGARRSAGLRGNLPIRLDARGLGGKNTEQSIESNHRGSVSNMLGRCGVRLTISGPNYGAVKKNVKRRFADVTDMATPMTAPLSQRWSMP